jgi:hypothetical protein
MTTKKNLDSLSVSIKDQRPNLIRKKMKRAYEVRDDYEGDLYDLHQEEWLATDLQARNDTRYRQFLNLLEGHYMALGLDEDKGRKALCKYVELRSGNRQLTQQTIPTPILGSQLTDEPWESIAVPVFSTASLQRNKRKVIGYLYHNAAVDVRLGGGTYSDVFPAAFVRASDFTTREVEIPVQTVVIKRLKPDGDEDFDDYEDSEDDEEQEERLDKFLNEVEMLSTFEPDLFIGYTEDRGIVMKKADMTLQQMANDTELFLVAAGTVATVGGVLDYSQVIEMMAYLMLILYRKYESIYLRRFAYNDIKPDNLLLIADPSQNTVAIFFNDWSFDLSTPYGHRHTWGTMCTNGLHTGVEAVSVLPELEAMFLTLLDVCVNGMYVSECVRMSNQVQELLRRVVQKAVTLDTENLLKRFKMQLLDIAKPLSGMNPNFYAIFLYGQLHNNNGSLIHELKETVGAKLTTYMFERLSGIIQDMCMESHEEIFANIHRKDLIRVPSSIPPKYFAAIRDTPMIEFLWQIKKSWAAVWPNVFVPSVKNGEEVQPRYDVTPRRYIEVLNGRQ